MATLRLFKFFVLSVLGAAVVWCSAYAAGGAAAAAPSVQPSGKVQSTIPAMRPDDLARRQSRCAVEDPDAEGQAAIEAAVNASRARDPKGIVTVPVYWHIVTTSSGAPNVSSLVPAQMDVLAAAFGPSGFAFDLKDVRVVANDDWFLAEAGSPEEVEMKAALRRGGPDALNIYTTNGDVYLGWATLPFNYRFFPSYDGVVLWWAALPGTGLVGTHPDEPDGVLTYDQGDTGTHEVGHWLGLHHTFAGGCSHPGDSIKDTPAEAVPQFFCAPRDSCVGPVFPGADPITNFMNYVDDVCMDHFTPEQTKRIRTHWHAFRNKKTTS